MRLLVRFAAGLMALAAFVSVEARGRHPMLPFGIFSSRQFTGANLVTFAVYAALSGVFFLVVVFLQTVLRYSPLAAGAAMLEGGAAWQSVAIEQNKPPTEIGSRDSVRVGRSTTRIPNRTLDPFGI